MNAFRYSKIVSISDEAFGLLLIENYLEKWKIMSANVTAGGRQRQHHGSRSRRRAEKEENKKNTGKVHRKAIGKVQVQWVEP